MKAMKQQLEESGRNAEAVQTEWYLAEQHLISVANVRDQQTVQQENLRDGNQRSFKKKKIHPKNPSQKSHQESIQRSIGSIQLPQDPEWPAKKCRLVCKRLPTVLGSPTDTKKDRTESQDPGGSSVQHNYK